MPDDQNPSTNDVTALAAAFVAKHGESKAVERLMDDNLALREKNRALKADLATASAAKPADGAVVLTGKDAEAWTAYQALGAPAEVTKKLADADTATSRLAAVEREQVIAKAATAAGYKPSVLTDLAAAKGFAVEVREEQGESGAIAVPYAVPTGADGKPGAAVKLADYVTAQLGDYLPALTAGAAGGATRSVGTAYPASRGTGAPPATGNAIDDVLAKNRERANAPNALRPKAA